MLEQLTQWLAQTQPSYFIQGVAWIVPMTQTIHILCVAVVMFATSVLNLSILGWVKQDPSAMAVHFLPWIWAALVVLLLTGSILVVGEPARELLSLVFRTKLVLVLCAVVLTALVPIGMRQDSRFWEVSGLRRWAARAIAAVSMSLWIAIVLAGRLIAYVDAS